MLLAGLWLGFKIFLIMVAVLALLGAVMKLAMALAKSFGFDGELGVVVVVLLVVCLILGIVAQANLHESHPPAEQVQQ